MMAQSLDRRTLESMKRADLQRLCKDHGIKANLKTEALVDLLAHTLQPRPPRAAHPPPVQTRRASSLRTSSRTSSGSHLRGASSSSVIIHDTDDEEEQPEVPKGGSAPPESQRAPPSSQSSTASLPKKSRQTQYRLGVGRPILAGGSGARAITKSVSLTKTKRGKGSISVKPSEDVIEEEAEPAESGPVAGPSGTSHETEHGTSANAQPSDTLASNTRDDSSSVAQVIQPLKDQIVHLQSEVQRLTAQMTDVDNLKTEVAGLSIEVAMLRTKLADMATLEAEVHKLRDVTSNTGDRTVVSTTVQSTKSAGKTRATEVPDGAATSLDVPADTAAQDVQPHPEFTARVLGKHPRDSDDSQPTGLEDAGKGSDELFPRAGRPTRKRAKLSPHATGSSHGSGRTAGSPDSAPERGTVVTPSAPAFAIFTGPEEPLDSYLDPPPPTAHLSDLLELPPANTAIGRFGVNGTTATANAHENNAQPPNAFNFSFTTTAFHPLTSTPAGPYGDDGMPSFIYPEPPTSPTPTVPRSPTGGYVERAGGRRERNDIFDPRGRARSTASRDDSLPPSRASTSQAGPSSEGTINPSTLMSSTPLPTVIEQDVDAELMDDARTVSSSEVGHVFGLGQLPLQPETPALPMRRTMYGTELEGDTRFGDFGVEGVAAAGFWVGAAPRF
ncbi:hypothetical protein EVJ58_g4048 [Rhodofomes roseus]|uniref:Uncharacterized protein n=1 Tax=Rhodofomes roseus TaxID=34475 RepID=A0A4Y9YKL3_9APHY|nr:hypothetical protein EVJ58_g4048 [Rhodofomes roseus]